MKRRKLTPDQRDALEVLIAAAVSFLIAAGALYALAHYGLVKLHRMPPQHIEESQHEQSRN